MNYQRINDVLQRVADRIDQMATVVKAEAQFDREAELLADRARDLREDRFRVLVVGEFSRGKSTLLNAMLGADVLPRKVLPCTAINTTIRYGSEPHVKVFYRDGHPVREMTVNEFRNEFALRVDDTSVDSDDSGDATPREGPVAVTKDFDRFSQVKEAVVTYPLELCRNRVNVIDSPGLGAEKTHTARTMRMLDQTDAVVMLLDATELLGDQERHFIQKVLLRRGLTNIFFPINRWNVLEGTVLSADELPRQTAELNQRIDKFLGPLCVMNGQDVRDERIFRVNALGALQARQQETPDSGMLEQTQVPALERALEGFLTNDRFRARADAVAKSLDQAFERIERYVQTQEQLLERSAEELESQWETLAPKFKQLKRRRDHLVEYLDSQREYLQQNISISLREEVRAIAESLSGRLDEFGLAELTGGSLLYQVATDWVREPDERLAARIDAQVRPSIQAYLEEHLDRWQKGPVQQAASTTFEEIQQYLRSELEECDAVLRDIDQSLGLKIGTGIQNDSSEQWLERELCSTHVKLNSMNTTGGVMLDLSGLAAGLVADLAFDITGAVVPVIGFVISGARLMLREKKLRADLRKDITERVSESLEALCDDSQVLIQEHVDRYIERMMNRVTQRVDQRVDAVEDGIRSLMDRRDTLDGSLATERQRLQSVLDMCRQLNSEIRADLFAVFAQDSPDRRRSAVEAIPLLNAGDSDANRFAATQNDVRRFIDDWRKLSGDMGERLGQRCEEGLDELDQSILSSYETLSEGLQRPELTLATAGTTSGGKSTVVNLLCGADLMPTAVDEKSAGVVTIRHSTQRYLKIHDTPAATWETGEWLDPTDEDIRELLDQMMNGYNAAREKAEKGTNGNGSAENTRAPVCPRADLQYPTDFARRLMEYGVPEDCTVRILDLPGLKHVNDVTNADVIAEAKDALSLVTYNSAERDPELQKKLLRQVVDQVKELNGSPARMLFVLNKIDEFRRDRDWPHSEERFVARTKEHIQTALREGLRESKHEIDQLHVTRLSSDPALCCRISETHNGHPKGRGKTGACMATVAATEGSSGDACSNGDSYESNGQDNGGQRTATYMDRINSFYVTLIPDDVNRTLPRFVEDWSAEQVEAVTEAVWETSYGRDFEQRLGTHIQQYFPEIVIPPVVDRFVTDSGRPGVEWLAQTARAELHGSQQRYKGECERIRRAQAELLEMRDACDRRLLKPFQKIHENLNSAPHDPSTLNSISDIIRDLQEQPPYDELPEDALAPLYLWFETGPRRAIETVLNVAGDALAQDTDTDFDAIEDLVRASSCRTLQSAIRKLVKAGYSANMAQHGWSVVTHDEPEKRKVVKIHNAIERLGKALEQVLADAANRSIRREVKRVYSATQKLLKQHVEGVSDQAAEIAPAIGLSVKPSSLDLVKSELSVDYELEADFDIDEQLIEVMQGRQPKRVDRPWYDPRSWFGMSKTVYVPNYVEKEQLSTAIPSVETLIGHWVVQAQFKEPDVFQQFNEWLMGQIHVVSTNIAEFQEELLSRYHEKLEDAHANAQESCEEDERFWKSVMTATESLGKQLDDLRKLEREAN